MLENYPDEGEHSRNVIANVAVIITTKLATTEVHEEVLEEELVDYEPSPEAVVVPCDPLLDLVRESEEDEEMRRIVKEDVMVVLTQFLLSFALAQEVPAREVVLEQMEGVIVEPHVDGQRGVDDEREVLLRGVEVAREY